MLVVKHFAPLLLEFGGWSGDVWKRRGESEVAPFRFANRMVGHDVYAFYNWMFRLELAEAGKMFGSVVDAWDDWRAENHRFAEAVEQRKRGKRREGRDAGVAQVEVRVSVFDVEEEEVNKRCERVQADGGNAAVGFERGVDVVFAAERQDVEQKIVLERGFAAGECDAAAGAFVVAFVFENGGENFFRCDAGADDSDVSAGTNFGAGAAGRAILEVESMFSVIKCVRADRADSSACAASIALREVDIYLRR